MKKCGILSVPTSLGASMKGTELGPKEIKKRLKFQFKDFGETQIETCPCKDYTKKRFPCIKNNNKKTESKIKNILLKKYFPIILGGDHSLTAGSVAGTASHYKNIGLIYVDAHGDFNTPKTSPSGNVHGMVISEITCNGFCNLSKQRPAVKEDKIVIIGMRDLDQGEKKRLKASNITCFSMSKVRKLGIKKVITEAMKITSKGTRGYYLSIDIDSLSPKIAPGTGYRVPGGLNKKEITTLIKEAKKGKLLAFDIVEVNPKRDIKNKTAEVAAELVTIVAK